MARHVPTGQTRKMSPIIWVLLSFPLLLILQRWIQQHLQGVMLLLTGNHDVATYLYFALMLPGVFLHELSHWLTAGLLGVRTGRFVLWPQRTKTGVRLGYVEYYRNGLGPVRESLIGMAPMLYGLAAIILITHFRFGLTDIVTLVQSESGAEMVAAVQRIFATPASFVWLYLLFAISNTMLPSKSDRRAWPGLLLILVTAGIALYFLDLLPVLVQGIANVSDAAVYYLALAFGMTAVVDVVAFVIIGVLELLLGRLRRQHVRYD